MEEQHVIPAARAVWRTRLAHLVVLQVYEWGEQRRIGSHQSDNRHSGFSPCLWVPRTCATSRRGGRDRMWPIHANSPFVVGLSLGPASYSMDAS